MEKFQELAKQRPKVVSMVEATLCVCSQAVLTRDNVNFSPTKFHAKRHMYLTTYYMHARMHERMHAHAHAHAHTHTHTHTESLLILSKCSDIWHTHSPHMVLHGRITVFVLQQKLDYVDTSILCSKKQGRPPCGLRGFK